MNMVSFNLNWPNRVVYSASLLPCHLLPITSCTRQAADFAIFAVREGAVWGNRRNGHGAASVWYP